jgi:MFS transporter, DHA1 family, multidrug resistance protein
MHQPAHATTSVRAVGVLIANSVFTSVGFFMIFPLISVRFTGQLGISASVVGAALAVRILCQQGLTMFGGAAADQIGHKTMIVLGMAIRASGFFVWGFADSEPGLYLGAVLSGLGGMLFDAPSRAGIAYHTAPGAARQRAFALSNMAGSIGSTIGPLLGVLLLPYDFRVIGIVSGAFFILISLQSLILLPTTRRTTGSGVRLGESLQALGQAARDRKFVRFTTTLTTYWFLYNQLFIAVPLASMALTGDPSTPGLIYALSAGMGIVLQYPVARFVAQHIPPFSAIALGLGFMGAGLLLFGLSPTLGLMLGCIAIYALGRIIVDPVQLNLVSEVAPAGKMGAYIGFSMLAFAVGGSLGNALGGALYDLSQALAIPVLIWLVMGATGLAGALAMLRLRADFDSTLGTHAKAATRS